MAQSILSIIILLCVSAFAGDADIGLSLISQGKFDEACDYINRAYKKEPSSPLVQFAYAKTVADGIKAQKIYKKVIDNKSAADSLKSEALYRLGCFYYCKEKYDSAEIMFTRADEFSSTAKNRHMKAFAAFSKGDNRTSESIWVNMVSNDNKENSNKALYYLGNSFYRQKKYEQSYNSYNKASKSNDEAWTVPALAGACLSAYNHGNTSRSAILYKQIQKEYPFSLESDLLKTVAPKSGTFTQADIDSSDDFGAIDLQDSEQKKVSEPKTGKIRYTLQVGAFTSAENAKKMCREMKMDFGHVTIKKETIKGKVFHKVRVGAFSQEKNALAYGEKHLKNRDIKFRVVKE